MTDFELKELSSKIAYITINPSGNFIKSAQLGFNDVGLKPKYLIYVKPTQRLLKEFKKYKFSFFSSFLLPQIKKFYGNKKSFSKEEVNIKIETTYRVSKLNSKETADLIKSLGIKYLINCGAGIFRKKIINIPGLIILNAHAGKLPMYKNMNVVEWAIYNGDKVYGTVHQIDLGIDTGPTWFEKEIELNNKSSLLEARDYSFDSVIRLVGKSVVSYEKGDILPVKYQNSEGKKWYKMHSYFKNKVEIILSQ